MKTKLIILLFALLNVGCRHSRFIFPGNDRDINNYVIFDSTWIANTGIAYDSNRNLMMFAGWDSRRDVSIMRVTSTSMVDYRVVEIPLLVSCAQGITYDYDHDHVIVWGYKPGTNNQIPALFVMSPEGRFVSELQNPQIEDSAGMLAYDSPNKLWIKSNEAVTTRLYHLPDMTVIREIDTGVHGEGIALRGNTLWVHGSCRIKKIDLLTGASSDTQSPNPFCGEEGLVFDGQGNLWVGNDNGFHFNEPHGNQAWEMNQRILP